MSYTFQNTVWPPQDIDPAIKHLIQRYYTLADFNGPEAGDVLADEVFTENGTMIGPLRKISGSKGCSPSITYSPILANTSRTYFKTEIDEVLQKFENRFKDLPVLLSRAGTRFSESTLAMTKDMISW